MIRLTAIPQHLPQQPVRQQLQRLLHRLAQPMFVHFLASFLPGRRVQRQFTGSTASDAAQSAGGVRRELLADLLQHILQLFDLRVRTLEFFAVFVRFAGSVSQRERERTKIFIFYFTN